MGRKQKLKYRKRHYIATPNQKAQKHHHELAGISLPKGWALLPDDTSLVTVAYFQQQATAASMPAITHCLKVLLDGSYIATVYERRVLNDRTDYPSQLTDLTNTLPIMLNTLLKMRLCPGNNDPEFIKLAEKKQGKFCNKEGQIIASLETSPLTTIRHHSCPFVHDHDKRCIHCNNHRKTLFSLSSKAKKSTGSATCTTYANYRFLTQSQMISSIKETRKEAKIAKLTVLQLKSKIENLESYTNENGVQLDQTTKIDFATIMQESNQKILDQYPEDSFERLFWSSQLQSIKKPKQSLRWHPAIIKWCIFLKHKSSSAYETLRSSCITLPSQRTLRDYTHYFESKTGFSATLDVQLAKASNVDSLDDYQKYVSIVADEMHLKENLVYDKFSQELIGFSDMGDINEHLLRLKDNVNSADPPLAKTMLTLMVRGLFTNFIFPYASFPSAHLTGDQLVPLFYEAVMRIERCGLKVISCTLDGNSVNRKFIKVIANDSPVANIKYFTKNPISHQNIYFFSDPPHLIKTVRNCLANPNRKMQINNKPISWNHIKQLYEMSTSSMGLTCLPKLKYEHLHLNSYSKMRVDLAAQVLSSTVATALKVFLPNEASETAIFVEYFDKFFDMLNVTNYTSTYKQLKPFKAPYRWGSDKRLEWLETNFLVWLNDWESQVRERNDVRGREKQKLMLSYETSYGVKMTAYSFIDLTRHIFTIPGVKSFLSEHLCQDPLEKFFGNQRQQGATNENPTVAQFLKNSQTLRVVSSITIDRSKGNTRGLKRPTSIPVDNQPLPKRRKKISESTKTEPSELNTCNLENALQTAINDDGFKIPTQVALTSLNVAKQLLTWCSIADHESIIREHTSYLSDLFSLWTSPHIMTQLIQEQIWQRFATFVSSTEYTLFWQSLFNMSGITTCDILAFYLTYNMFIAHWKSRHPSMSQSCSNQTMAVGPVSLTFDEKSALWYVGGYVIYSVKKKITKLKNVSFKEQLLQLLLSFTEDSAINSDWEVDSTKEWFNSVNRGGLVQCTNNFHSFLYTVELLIKELITNQKTLKAITNDPYILSSNESVVEAWKELTECNDDMYEARSHNLEEISSSLMTYESGGETQPESCHGAEATVTTYLKREILKLYITIRGFSYTSQYLEHYKKTKAKTIQKEKSIRTKLQQS